MRFAFVALVIAPCLVVTLRAPVREDGPPARAHHALAYPNGDLADTWEWDGTKWTRFAD